MAGPVSEKGFRVHLVDYTEDYTGGATASFDHNIAVRSGQVVVLHVGLAMLQTTSEEPVGGVIGVSEFGPQSFGGPAQWETAGYGTVNTFTVSAAVYHGEMTGWYFFQIWQ